MVQRTWSWPSLGWGVMVAAALAACGGPENVPPMPVLDAPAEVRVGAPAAFSCLDSRDPDGLVVSCRFDFGDESTAVAGVLRAVHVYERAGIYTVRVTVIDDDGASAETAQQLLVVANQAPVAALVAPEWATVGEEVAFDAAGSLDSDGRIVAYAYDFGDGATAAGSNLQRVVHTYGQPGVYTVRLDVRDDDGASDVVERQIVVATMAAAEVQPQACFTGPTVGTTDEDLSWDASCSIVPAAAITYQFDFGDGGSAAGRLVTHRYQRTGSYRVQLVVIASYSDGSTAWSRADALVAVTDASVAIRSVAPTSGGVAGGEWVTITGWGFAATSGAEVWFGGQQAVDLTVVDDGTIVARTPAGRPGAVDVTVRTGRGVTTATAAYNYLGGGNRADTSYCPPTTSASGSLGFAGNDVDAQRTVQVPFDLPFFDRVVPAGSIAYVATNGYLSFSDARLVTANAKIPSAQNPDELVAVFFDDLQMAGGQVYSVVSGSAPNRVWSLVWDGVATNDVTPERLWFAVQFYEGSGDIRMLYAHPATHGRRTLAQQATIGLQKDARTGVLYSFDTTVPGLAPGGKVVRFAYTNGSYTIADFATLSASPLTPPTEAILPRGMPFRILFANPLNPASVTAGTTVKVTDLTVPGAVPVTLAYEQDKRVLAGYPATTLTFGHRYRVEVTDVVDVYGQRLQTDPSVVACGGSGRSAAFTMTFIAGPQRMSFSQQLATGGAPMGVATYLDNNGAATVLVAKDNGDLVSFAASDLNTARGTLAGLGNAFEQLAVVRYPGGATAVIADSGARTIELVDVWDPTAMASLATINPALGGSRPRGVAIGPSGRKAFVAENGNDTVIVVDLVGRAEIDTDPNAAGTNPIFLPQGCNPRRVARVGDWIYASCNGSEQLVRIDPMTYVIAVYSLPAGTRVRGLVGDSTGRWLYLGDRGNGQLLVWDTRSDTLVAQVALGGGVTPENLAITGDDRILFVADSGNGEILAIDLESLVLLDRYVGLNTPIGIAVLPDGWQAVAGDNGTDVLVRLE